MRKRTLIGLSLLVAAGCGGHIAATTDDGGASDGGTTHDGGIVPPPLTDGGGPFPDAGFFDASPPPPPPPPPPPVGNYGYVALQNNVQGGTGSSAGAGFFHGVQRPCVLGTPQGTCEVAQCPNGGVQGYSAGTIAVSSSSGPIAALTPSGSAGSVTYAGWQSSSLSFSSMQSLFISATGGDVPAFGAMFHFPFPTMIIQPQLAQGMTVIPTTQDLFLEWAPTSDEVLFYASDANNMAPAQPILVCVFASSQAKARVPQASLAAFKGTLGSGAQVFAGLFSLSREPVSTPGWFVDLFGLGSGEFGIVQLQ